MWYIRSVIVELKVCVVWLQAAIVNAKTLEEVERLNKLLQAGHIPGKENGHPQQQGNP